MPRSSQKRRNPKGSARSPWHLRPKIKCMPRPRCLIQAAQTAIKAYCDVRQTSAAFRHTHQNHISVRLGQTPVDRQIGIGLIATSIQLAAINRMQDAAGFGAHRPLQSTPERLRNNLLIATTRAFAFTTLPVLSDFHVKTHLADTMLPPFRSWCMRPPNDPAHVHAESL